MRVYRSILCVVAGLAAGFFLVPRAETPKAAPFTGCTASRCLGSSIPSCCCATRPPVDPPEIKP